MQQLRRSVNGLNDKTIRKSTKTGTYTRFAVIRWFFNDAITD